MYLAYLRVSTQEQNLARQEQAIADWQAQNNIQKEDLKVFAEKISGKDTNRPQLQELLHFIRERDTVVIQSLDRLGRNSADIKNLLQDIQSRGASIEILDLPSFAGVNDRALKDLLTNLVIEVFSYVAESERLKIKERQRQGIEIAKTKGAYKGRQTRYHAGATGTDKLVYDKIVNDLKTGIAVSKIANSVNVSRNTVYKIQKQLKQEESA